MKKTSALLLVFILVPLALFSTLFSLTASPTIGASASVKGWILKQTTDYAGTLKTIISNQGSCMTMGELGFVCLQPFSSVVITNSESKKYCKMSVTEWQKTFANQRNEWENPVLIGHGKLSGLNVDKYMVRHKKFHFNDREMWVTKELKIDKASQQMLFTICQLPTTDGFPLKVMQVKGGKPITVLNTTAVTRGDVNLPSAGVPKGYAAVKTHLELFSFTEKGILDDKRDPLSDF